MKKMFCLLFVVSGLLLGQQKPFCFWNFVQINTVRPVPPTLSATGGYLDATISLSNNGDTFLFFRGTDTTSLTLIASTSNTVFLDTPLTAGTYSYYSKKIVDGDTSYFSSADTALVLDLILLTGFAGQYNDDEYIADSDNRDFSFGDDVKWLSNAVGLTEPCPCASGWVLESNYWVGNIVDVSGSGVIFQSSTSLGIESLDVIEVVTGDTLIFTGEYYQEEETHEGQVTLTVSPIDYSEPFIMDVRDEWTPFVFRGNGEYLGTPEAIELLFTDNVFPQGSSFWKVRLDNLSMVRRRYTGVYTKDLAAQPLSVFYNGVKLNAGNYSTLQVDEWGYNLGILYINIDEDPINGTLGYEL